MVSLLEWPVISKGLGQPQTRYRGIDVVNPSTIFFHVGMRSKKCGFLTNLPPSLPPFYFQVLEKQQIYPLCVSSVSLAEMSNNPPPNRTVLEDGLVGVGTRLITRFG